jgi:hypothetical protein
MEEFIHKSKSSFVLTCIIRLSSLLFFLINVADESIPLYVTSPTIVKGLGFSPAKFAIIWSSVGVLGALYRFTILPWGNRRYDTIQLLKFSYFCYITYLVLLPMSTSIQSWLELHVVDEAIREILFLTCYILILHFRTVATCFSFPSVLIMVGK